MPAPIKNSQQFCTPDPECVPRRPEDKNSDENEDDDAAAAKQGEEARPECQGLHNLDWRTRGEEVHAHQRERLDCANGE